MITPVENSNTFSTAPVENSELVEKYTYMLAYALEDDYNMKSSLYDSKFVVVKNRKYIRIEQHNNQKSIVCFVDKNNGDVYKPADWNKPAKNVRYNLNKDLEWLLCNADWAGGFLYMKNA